MTCFFPCIPYKCKCKCKCKEELTERELLFARLNPEYSKLLHQIGLLRAKKRILENQLTMKLIERGI